MKIKIKLILAMGLLLGTLVSMQSINYYTSKQVRSSYQEMVEGSQFRYLLKAVQFRMTGISNDERAYLLKGDEEFTKEINQKAEEVIADLKEMEKMPNVPPADRENLAKVRALFTDFIQASDQVRQMYKEGHHLEADQLHFTTERQVRKELDLIVADLLTKVEKDLLEEGKRNEAFANLIDRITWIFTGIALLFGFIVGILLYRSIVKPIQQVNRQLKEIADGEGDLTKELQISSRDEIGELGDSFNRMLANLRNLILQVRSNTVQVASSSEELTASAAQTSKATEQIAQTIQEVSEVTEQQVQSVESGSRAMNQLSAFVQQIASNAQSASATALQAADMAWAGNQDMQTAVNQVGTVNHTMNNLTEVVKGLGVRSQEIGQIVEVITGIAGQTNLLALNAAIEAARAGEHGRGFSVVADEVRKLAEQSSQSAHQIAQLIAAIQEETNKAMSTMETSRVEVLQGIEIVTAAGAIFAEIQQTVKEVSAQIEEVSMASRQMEDGTQGVVKAIDQISAATVHTSAGTQEVSAATEEQLASMEEIASSAASLSKMAEELQGLIDQFKV
ncbi:methyl-accepting chemotaxis protein [Brevibacillus ginsengisoli]|uniref:methyl-accepting chemotaxis protein n=1 Tax=Brevibacillus ginsengisoli TaxID=363854 RepID=UPI003CED22B0